VAALKRGGGLLANERTAAFLASARRGDNGCDPFHRSAGQVLAWDEVEVGAPATGQVRLRQTAVGLNYIDVYHRTGAYPVAAMPSGIGLEGAGVVE
jgi:hypothetical protein